MNVFIHAAYSPTKNMGVGAYLVISPEEVKIYKRFRVVELDSMLGADIKYYETRDVESVSEVERMTLEMALAQADKELVTSVVDPNPIVYTESSEFETNADYKVCNPYPQDLSGLRASQVLGKSKIYDLVKVSSQKRLRQFAE